MILVMSYEIIKEGKNYYPITSSQLNIIQGEQVGAAYSNICILFHFDSEIDMKLMEQAVNAALERMPTARLRRHKFNDDKNIGQNATLQYFSDEPIDKASVMSFKSNEKMRKYLEKLSKKPFPKKSEDTCLYQMILINKADGGKALYCKMHHFINDAYGIMILAGDVLKIYKAMLTGGEMPKAPDPVLPAFEDQWSYFGSKNEAKAQAYWDEFWNTHELPQFGTINEPENDKQTLPDEKFGNQFHLLHKKAAYVAYPFKKDLVDKINEYAEANGVSPQVLFLLAYRTYVYKMSGGRAKNQVLQTMNANRSKKCAKNTSGTFVSGYLFYFDVANSETFADACKYTSNMQLEYYKYCRIRNVLGERNLKANMKINENIFDKGWIRASTSNMFTYQPYTIDPSIDVKFHMERFSSGITAMSLYLTIMYMDNYSGDLMGCYDYSTYNLSEETVRKFHYWMVDFLERALANPEKTLDELM